MVGLYRLDAFASRDAPALPVFAEDGAVAETATATACNDAAGAGPGQQRQRQMQQQPRLGDALVYLNQVRREFQSQPNVYNEFLDIFRSRQFDRHAVVERVCDLFHGNERLILGFNTLLPQGHRVDFVRDEGPAARSPYPIYRHPGNASAIRMLDPARAAVNGALLEAPPTPRRQRRRRPFPLYRNDAVSAPVALEPPASILASRLRSVHALLLLISNLPPSSHPFSPCSADLQRRVIGHNRPIPDRAGNDAAVLSPILVTP